MDRDTGLDTLLDLDGYILDQDDGYWVKIEARVVPVTKAVPHGIRYSLTLHEPHGNRVLGYDNAHAVKPPKKFKYAGQIRTHDHKHRQTHDKGVPYDFQSAEQLLKDFFVDVDRRLAEVKQR